MTRLLEYMKEDESKSFINGVERKCSSYLKIYKRHNGKFYRTHGDRVETYTLKKTRKNRRPLDSPLFLHNLVDDWMKKNFGWRGRSEGLFVWGEWSEWISHSDLVFPIGDFDFLWNPKVEDLYDTFTKIDNDLADIQDPTPEDLKPIFYELKKEILPFYTNKDIKKFWYTGCEMMIKCDKYYLVNKSWFENYIEPSEEWKNMIRKV